MKMKVIQDSKCKEHEKKEDIMLFCDIKALYYVKSVWMERIIIIFWALNIVQW